MNYMNPRKICLLLFIGLFGAAGICGRAAAEKTAQIAYVEWSSAIAATHVVKAVLQEKMGYDVELTAVSDAAAMWRATADGDTDGFVCAWLPNLHARYQENLKNDVINLGPNLEGTRMGLVVPAYVTVDTIAELDAHAERFNGRITGIDQGAGIMAVTEKAMDAYDIDNLELKASSGVMMTVVLEDKIKNKKWVVVTGWTPHWKFHRFDLKYLKDPKKIYGGTEYIKTVVRKNLKTEKPELYQFLDNFQWKTADIHAVMDYIRQSGNPHESAIQWVRDNPEKVKAWLPE
ncbi:MAG: glycine betaine ABC transporter substrate-binding protein [Desulfovibrionales bacterium]